MPPRSRAPRYGFRAVTEADLPMLGRWLAEPHLREWWGEPKAALAEMTAAIDDVATEPLIAELAGRPVAYIQVYDPHLEDGHPYQDQPFGTLGVDLSVGPPEMLGKGHGPAMLDQLALELFAEGAPRLVIDPHPANARAIRAYAKAGFTAFDERMTVYGPALMMARDAPEEDA